MDTAIVPDLQYPIGNFIKKDHYTTGETETMIKEIAASSARYEALVSTLSETDLLKLTGKEAGT